MPSNGPRTRTPGATAGHPRRDPARSADAAQAVPRPGVVAATVLRAARLSAGVSEDRLAAAADAEQAAILAWEDGSDALAFAVYPRVERLETALRSAGSDPRFVADLYAAAWCDLVLLALGGDGDVTCLLADPITGEDGFRDLLAWALTGVAPHRYRSYVHTGPPLDARHIPFPGSLPRSTR